MIIDIADIKISISHRFKKALIIFIYIDLKTDIDPSLYIHRDYKGPAHYGFVTRSIVTHSRVKHSSNQRRQLSLGGGD